MNVKFKSLIFPIACVFLFLVLLLAICTTYEGLKRDQFANEKLENKIQLSKSVFGKACNREESYCIDDVLILRGSITETTLSDLKELARTQGDKKVSAICFDSPGGNVIKAGGLGKWILKSKLPTCMAEVYFVNDKKGQLRKIKNTKCSSSCNFLLLASNKRIAIGSDFKIVTHSAGNNFSFCFCSAPLSIRLMNSFVFKSLLSRDDNPDREQHLDFLAFSKTIDFSESYQLTSFDIEKFKIFTWRLVDQMVE